MILLIVDDQTNVIDGLLQGIDFQRAKIDRILTAYNAAQAKEQLLMYPVDLLLCDIEMPGENGLSLLRWTNEHNMDLECIFLTAHADFAYAKTAMQLHSFDYILQPARYEDILSALIRAQMRLEERREHQHFYTLGKKMFQEQKNLADQAVSTWWEQRSDSNTYAAVKDHFQNMGISIQDVTSVLPIYLQINRWNGKPWEDQLLRYALENILNELLEQEGANIHFWRLSNCEYLGLCIFSAGKAEISETFSVSLQKFLTCIQELMQCELSLYVGRPSSFQNCHQQFAHLKNVQKDNVAQKSLIMYTPSNQSSQMSVPSLDFPELSGLLQRGLGISVLNRCSEYFDLLQSHDQLNAQALQNFYHHFYKVLLLVELKTDTSHEQIFNTPEKQQTSLHAYESLTLMMEFLRIATSYFNTKNEDDTPAQAKIDQIKTYIHSHLDEEIRREEIACALFLNPNYLSRLFKNETGISLKEYITQEKMKMAQSLLQNSKLPVYIIAQKVGYCNFSHFSQVYKKTFHISPTDERAKYDLQNN